MPFGRKPASLRSTTGDSFTERVRKVLAMARKEASQRGRSSVGTEHILLGLIREGAGVGAAVLQNLAVDFDALQQEIESVTATREPTPPVRSGFPYTSGARRVMELSMNEARELNHTYVGTEHLLLGLLREDKGIAAQVLMSADVTVERARKEALRLLGAADQEPAFTIEIDDTSSRSIYEQIIHQIQEGIATKRLEPHDRLPTVRHLADQLDIAPGTVARAYSELERLGVVVTDGARGTRVAAHGAGAVAASERFDSLVGRLRPIAVEAFHLGASAAELRRALKVAIDGIFT